MSNNDLRMGELLNQFNAANLQDDRQKLLNIILKIMKLFRESDSLQNDSNLKKYIFSKMNEYLIFVSRLNSLQSEERNNLNKIILETMIDTYYQGYTDAPFDEPLFLYLIRNYILPSRIYDPVHNSDNIQNINPEYLMDFTLHKAPTQNIADKIRQDIKRHTTSVTGGKKRNIIKKKKTIKKHRKHLTIKNKRRLYK